MTNLSTNAKITLDVFTEILGNNVSITLVDVRKELIEKFGLNNNSVTSNIGVLKNKGFIIMNDDKTYSLSKLEEIPSTLNAVNYNLKDSEEDKSNKNTFAQSLLNSLNSQEPIKEVKKQNNISKNYNVPQEIEESIQVVIDSLELTVKKLLVFKSYQTIRFNKNKGFLELNVYQDAVRILFKGKYAQQALELIKSKITEDDIEDKDEKVAYSYITVSRQVFENLKNK